MLVDLARIWLGFRGWGLARPSVEAATEAVAVLLRCWWGVGLSVAAARGIVEGAGEGQLDASGERLISDLGRVGGVVPLFAGPVAWLHDVVARSSGMPGALMDEQERDAYPGSAG